jgi:vesicle-fusing ATPase
MTINAQIESSGMSAVEEMRAALALDCTALKARLAALTAGGTGNTEQLAPTGSALGTLASLFLLTPLERDLLCLAAGPDLEPGLASAISESTGGGRRADVSLALALFGPSAWDALCPAAPLRQRRLIELTGSEPMLGRRLEVDERVLHFLMGLNYLDARLEGIVHDLAPATASIGNAARAVVKRITAAWSQPGAMPVLLLAGSDRLATRETLLEASTALGITLFRIDAADIPADWIQRHALATYIDREMALSDGALLIECRHTGSLEAGRLTDLLGCPTAISATDPDIPDRGPRLRIDVAGPGVRERRAIWAETLRQRADALGAGLDRLAEQFALDRAGVLAAAESLMNGTEILPDRLLPELWRAAREQGRRQLDGLAERIESNADWNDLVLPESQMAQLRDLALHVREAWRVSEEWGWRTKSPRGLGTAALFTGPSGTGKTFAAEVLSKHLDLDLYRIDLSQVVSKYIGETEKNLSRIFTAAEHGGAILLFDEADALFGKRSEVKDSHDRYANVEVSYLLQQMEAYRGLAILTTNQKGALDTAFLRRLRSVIQFPFPDATARAEIWARIFPEATPAKGLDFTRLARLNISGGSIRSIALNASYLAAGAGDPVTPAYILRAAQREYAKLEKPMTAAETEL